MMMKTNIRPYHCPKICEFINPIIPRRNYLSGTVKGTLFEVQWCHHGLSSLGAGLSGPGGPPPGDVGMGGPPPGDVGISGPDLVTVLCEPNDHGCRGLVQHCEKVLPPTSSVLPPDRKLTASASVSSSLIFLHFNHTSSWSSSHRNHHHLFFRHGHRQTSYFLLGQFICLQFVNNKIVSQQNVSYTRVTIYIRKHSSLNK